MFGAAGSASPQFTAAGRYGIKREYQLRRRWQAAAYEIYEQ
jgi:hypothetical protein